MAINQFLFAVFSNFGGECVCRFICHLNVDYQKSPLDMVPGRVINGEWPFKANICKGIMEFDSPSGHRVLDHLFFVPLTAIPGITPSMVHDYNEVMAHIEKTKFSPVSFSYLFYLRTQNLSLRARILLRRLRLAVKVFWLGLHGQSITVGPHSTLTKPEEDDIPF